MPRPLIGVTTSISVNAYPERAFLNSSYIRAVQNAGGTPVLLPPQLVGEARDELSHRLHGLLLTGGADIDPARFGELPHATVYDVSASRDELEFTVVDSALGAGVPVFAICRGIQVLNVALGGTLIQDVPSEVGTAITHSQPEQRHVATHRVTVSGETKMAAVLGALDLRVNSFHHQAIKKLGRGLREVGWSEDGVIEAVEMPDSRSLVLGVQWHPEELVDHDSAAANLFQALVSAAAQRV